MSETAATRDTLKRNGQQGFILPFVVYRIAL